MKRATLSLLVIISILAINACTNNPVAPIIQYITTWNKVDGVTFQREGIGGFSSSPAGPVTYGKLIMTYGIGSGGYAYSFAVYATNTTANWNVGDLIFRNQEFGTIAMRLDETNRVTFVTEMKNQSNITKTGPVAITTNGSSGPYTNPFRKRQMRDFDGYSVFLVEWPLYTNSASAAMDQTNAPFANLWMKQ